MRDLFYLEWLRYRKWAILLAVLNFCAVAFVYKLGDMLQFGIEEFVAWLALYAIPSFLFGLWQGHSYSKPNQWLLLMHRPVQPRYIGMALSLAGLLVLSLAFILPLLLNLVLATQYVDRVVDSRHWVLPLSALLVCAACYFSGLLIRLSAAYWTALLLPALGMLWFAPAMGNAALILQAVAALALWALCVAVFQADRDQVLSRAPNLALALMLCLLGAHAALLAAGNVSYKAALSVTGNSPTHDVPPVGGYIEAKRLKDIDSMKGMLALAPAQRNLLTQLHAHKINLLWDKPQSQQHGALTARTFWDYSEEGRWSYNHDERRFIGFKRTSRDRLPDLAPNNQDMRFESVPKKLNWNVFADGPRLYQYDGKQTAFVKVLELGENETILAGDFPRDANTLILSSASLSIFGSEVLSPRGAEARAISPLFQVKLPAAAAELDSLAIVELADSFLVNFLYGRGNERGESIARQYLIHVSKTGGSALLAERTLKDDYAAAYLFDRQLLSPVLSTIWQSLRPYLNADSMPPQRATPTEITIWAAWLSVLSLALMAYWLKARTMSWQRRASLLAFATLGGLPAALAIAMLLPRTLEVPRFFSRTKAQAPVTQS